MFFDKEISIFQAEFNHKEDALEQLADLLATEKLVEADYKQSVLEREAVFPTGLPTVPFGVAIPHTDSHKVKKTQIAFASLKKPVKFRVMGSSSTETDVSIIFLLAIKNADAHIEMLPKLINMFQSEELVISLAGCKNQQDLNQVLQKAGLE